MREILKGVVAFDGPDCSGKTEIIKLLKEKEILPKETLYGNNPQKKDFGAFVRKYSEKNEMLSDSLLLAYAADFNEYLNGKHGIRENLKKGNFVVSDRWPIVAYFLQPSFSRDLYKNIPYPQLYIIFENSYETYLERKNQRAATQQNNIDKLYEASDYQNFKDYSTFFTTEAEKIKEETKGQTTVAFVSSEGTKEQVLSRVLIVLKQYGFVNEKEGKK